MPIAACYVRVSTENQRENYSIAEQTARLKAFCQAKDITIGNFFTDSGYSGGNVHRPALQKMLSSLKDFDTVIVYKLDRLSRSQKDTLLLIEDYFLAQNINFISVCENFDTSTPFGRATIGLLSIFAQLEKDQITERFTMGRIGRAKNGYYHGGPHAPTGYDYVDGRLVINVYEAMQIQELFERFEKGYSIHNCWRYMQEHYSTKYGNWKSETLVRNILQNEVYIGRVTFGGVSYPGKHRPIVSEQLFYHVQDMLKERQQRSPQNTQTISNAQSTPNTAKRPFQASTLLSGLLYCKKCGARYHGEHGNYTCYSRSKGDKKYIRNPACKNRKWKIAELDALVTDILCRLDFEALELSPLNMFSLDTALSGTDTSCRFPAKEDYQERITAIESEQKNLEEQTSRLLNLYQLGTISFDMISAKAEEVQGEKDRLDKEAKTLAKWADSKISETSDLFIPYDRDYNLSAAKQLHHLLTSASLPERRTCVQLLIYKIILDEENVEILLNDII